MNNTKPKKVGIIGLGGMGRRHCEALKQITDAELVAVCDRNQEALNKVKEEYGVLRGYTQWRQLLDNEDLDLVIIATNGPTHAEITIAAANRGIPRIVCEKPMANSLSQAREMIKSCKDNNVRLTVNHIRRWVPSYIRLKELLAEGIIGDVRHVTFQMAGGQIASNGGHFWDLVRFLTGKEPVRVQGFLDKNGTVNPRGAQYMDPGAYGLLWLEGNIPE